MAITAKPLDLSSIWLFSSCSAGELRKIRRSLDESTVPAGKVLCEEGAIGREFFIIVDGSVTVTRHGKKIATLQNGASFGELALLDRKPRSATVVAATETRLLVLAQRQFTGLLDDIPTLSRKLLAAMAERLREADAKAFH
jgi:CRP-like cAMP-binding protein